ncbi:heterokaryon incompatibility protein-domain-containing protein [Xylaria curta]|nr:heterokaryon incompatibility protein-domain-containing protein [Xylaria curta]
MDAVSLSSSDSFCSDSSYLYSLRSGDVQLSNGDVRLKRGAIRQRGRGIYMDMTEIPLHLGIDLLPPKNSPTELEFLEQISLYELCESCQRFADTCPLFDQVMSETSEEIIPTDSREPSSWDYEAGTIAQARANCAKCHLCMLILKNLLVLRVQHKFDLSAILHDKRRMIMSVSSWDLAIKGDIAEDDDNPRYWFYLASRTCTRSQGPSHGLRFHASSQVPRYAIQNVACIEFWLRDCMRTHDKCKIPPLSSTTGSQWPTRLLQVDDTGVRLKCNPDPDKDKYLTLSHMWGSHKHLFLTSNVLNDFKIQIPTEDLSRVHLDAMKLAKTMGYNFIWIDSLCIIQDSREDWEREAMNMAAVYSNGDCNICCLFPSDDVEPRLREDPRTMLPCVVRELSQDSEKVLYIESADYHYNI